MSLLDSLDAFVTGTYTVTRKTTGGYDSAGKKVAGTPSTFSADGSLQPLTGRDLMVLAEGQRSEDTQWFYTATALHSRIPGFEPDEIAVGGETWVVKNVETWNMDDETFYRCKVARKVVP